MKLFFLSFIFALCSISIKLKAQSADTSSINQFEVWRQRINIGLSAGYPTIPFINLGMKFYDKVYLDVFIEPGETRKYSSFFSIGYQKNRILNKNLCSQIGLSLLQVQPKDDGKKINQFGMNIKLIKPFTSRLGFFLSSHIGYPDSRVNYEKLININIGVDFYFKNVPILLY